MTGADAVILRNSGGRVFLMAILSHADVHQAVVPLLPTEEHLPAYSTVVMTGPALNDPRIILVVW